MKILLAAVLAAAPALFDGATESKWTISKNGAPAGTATLLTGAKGARVEVKSDPKKPATVFLASNGKVWLRTTGGDVDFATISAMTDESTVAPALLAVSESYRGAKAKYTRDAKGPSKIEITSGGTKYTLTRTAVGASNADASNFAIRPKKGAASQLAKLSGDLLGTSKGNASATAGGRGAAPIVKLDDGGDYAALETLETRDAQWRATLDPALEEFQKDGKVGKGREQ